MLLGVGSFIKLKCLIYLTLWSLYIAICRVK